MRRLVPLMCFLASATARATPHDLPFSYPYATNPAGELEVEQYTDLTPVPVYNSNGNPTTAPAATLVTEIEYGLTDNLELGLYFQLSDNPGQWLTGSPTQPEAPLGFDGVKQRIRYRIGHAGQLPVDTSLYLEIAELQNEIEIEGKINLEKNFGRWKFLVNLWAEREFYTTGIQEWVLNPTAGFSFQLVPSFHLGLEYWMHAELGGPASTYNTEPHHYLGPAALFQSTHFWVSVAPYLRIDRVGQATPSGVDALYGPVWIRTVFGYQF
jgi:hypothetical protein